MPSFYHTQEVAFCGRIWAVSIGSGMAPTLYCSGQKAVRFSLGASFEAVDLANDFFGEVVDY